MSETLPQLPPAAALEVRERYYGQPALFLEEVLGMELDEWQRELCEEFHEHDRFAIASGHSSGKSALTAGLIQYFLAVHPDPQVIVTANTQQQLREKTWRELAKWHQKSLVREWFQWTATQFSLKECPETWFASAVPNTPHSSESFAGAHEKYMLLIFDEASAIDQAIWEVSEGATATPGGYRKWLVFGNPTRNDGAFFQCFHAMRHRWRCKQLDTRGCKYADQKQIAQWAEDYGEDSDFFRVRVLGQFPERAERQFIGNAMVQAAQERKLKGESYVFSPVVMGVDVARFGGDQSVITLRQGLVVLKQEAYRGLRTTELASIVAQHLDTHQPRIAACFVDEGSMGAGVIDRLVQLGRSVTGVNFGEKAGDGSKYSNKRVEMWGRMRDWLQNGQIPDDSELRDDLTGPEYGYDRKERLLLEKKEDMRRRGLSSPDKGDSLALTFAEMVYAPEMSAPPEVYEEVY